MKIYHVFEHIPCEGSFYRATFDSHETATAYAHKLAEREYSNVFDRKDIRQFTNGFFVKEGTLHTSAEVDV
jgi:hypothetical protein